MQFRSYMARGMIAIEKNANPFAFTNSPSHPKSRLGRCRIAFDQRYKVASRGMDRLSHVRPKVLLDGNNPASPLQTAQRCEQERASAIVDSCLHNNVGTNLPE